MSVGMQFELSIDLGNNAMMSPQDVALALRKLAQRLDDEAPSTEESCGNVHDGNGNTVGTWTYENDSAEDETDDE